jgi:hypothetical protein
LLALWISGSRRRKNAKHCDKDDAFFHAIVADLKKIFLASANATSICE